MTDYSGFPKDSDVKKILRRLKSLDYKIEIHRGRSLVGQNTERQLERIRRNRFCRYCDLALPVGKRTAHNVCARAFALLCGKTQNMMGYLARKGECATCDANGYVLDHVLSLETARIKAVLDKNIKGWIAAHLPSNLQWLCADCNKPKTAHDAALLADERRRLTAKAAGQKSFSIISL